MSKTRKLGRTPDEGVYQFESSVTYEVGSGGDYATLNEAIEAVSKSYPIYKQSGVRVTLQMVAGFGMEEQVLVDGIDLSWITITGVDATTTIVRSALDTGFVGRFPAFGVANGGFAPVIDQLFDMDSSGSSSDRNFLDLNNNSRGVILPNAGCINVGDRGINAFRSSVVSAEDSNFSNAGVYAIIAWRSCIAEVNGAVCLNAGSEAIYADRSSVVNAQATDCSGSGEDGFRVRRGSLINANAATGSISQTANTLTSDGIIFQ